jgi:hypothetical protein
MMSTLHELVELVLSSLSKVATPEHFDFTLPLVALHQRDLLDCCRAAKKTQSSNHTLMDIQSWGSFEIIGDSINIQ